jgi:hypothetical protein
VFEGPALQHVIAEGIRIDYRIPPVPLALWLGVEPDEATVTLADVGKRSGLRVKVVVTGIAQDQDDRLEAEVAQQITVDFAIALGQLPNVTVLPLDTALGQRALELAASMSCAVLTQCMQQWRCTLAAL